MERLTRRLSDGTAYTGAVIDTGIAGANYPTYIGEAVDKLAAYEDAEEQGQILRLPCKVENTIYIPPNRKDKSMTEKEAIIRFEFIRCALLGGTKPHIVPNEENIALIDAAIKALKEVQQYRALETEVEKYRQIGTPEECQKWKEQKKGRKGSHD